MKKWPIPPVYILHWSIFMTEECGEYNEGTCYVLLMVVMIPYAWIKALKGRMFDWVSKLFLGLKSITAWDIALSDEPQKPQTQHVRS